jgi:hypothetical protein
MKKTLQILFVLTVLFLFTLQSHADEPVLTVNGAVRTPVNFSLREIESMTFTIISAKDPDGSTNFYDGIPPAIFLSWVGVLRGPALHGDDMQLCVLVKGADGYKAVFSLAELDPSFTDKEVVLAFRRNGKELDAKTGPLLLVVPNDKRHNRWVRQVTDLEIVRVNSSAKP